jgi:nucleotide-binding universal stress UspA family protein
MTFKKIVVAIDRSPQANQVFETAMEQAHLDKAQLLLTHCIRRETDIQSAPFMGIGTIADIDTYGNLKRLQQEQLQKDLEQAQTWLYQTVQPATQQGISVEVDCRVGEPSLEICNLARNWGADLIIIGRRGHQGLSEIVLGSVSNYVVHHAPCSVLVVQGTVTPMSEAEIEDRARMEV